MGIRGCSAYRYNAWAMQAGGRGEQCVLMADSIALHMHLALRGLREARLRGAGCLALPQPACAASALRVHRRVKGMAWASRLCDVCVTGIMASWHGTPFNVRRLCDGECLTCPRARYARCGSRGAGARAAAKGKIIRYAICGARGAGARASTPKKENGSKGTCG